MFDDMQEGTVYFFSSERGFGFIKADNGSGSIFVASSAIVPKGATLTEGQRVTFITKQGQKGIEADKVSLM